MNTLTTRLSAAAATTALAAAGLIGASATAQAAVPACGTSALTVTRTPSDGATGHGSFVLLFRNRSQHTCSLHGYPGLDALTKHGHVLAHAKRTLHGFAGGASLVKTVDLAPGGFASATVEWMNFNPSTGGDCATSASVATTPANTSYTVTLPAAVTVCDLQVHPTVAGTSGNRHFADAQHAWLAGAPAVSADQGTFWTAAETDLSKDGDEYSEAVATLAELLSLPDADQTPAQNATFHHDVELLDGFFSTPGLYS